MNHFYSLRELLNTLSKGSRLLMEMFEKRRSLSFKHEQALELLDDKEDIIQLLISKGVIIQNGAYIEIDDQFLDFFEQILEVNEEINTAYINDNIDQVKQNILYYLQENSESRKHRYLKTVKAILKKIGRITIRNIVDLNRNVEDTFKTEPNYKVKLSKLENHRKKLGDIKGLIEQAEKLISEDERMFFTTAFDEELRSITTDLRLRMRESRHNLIETQEQILEFINQIKHQSRFIEKLRQVKYLKDQFELRARTNIDTLLQQTHTLAMESKPSYRFKLSLTDLQRDEIYEIIKKVSEKIQTRVKLVVPIAERISEDYLELVTENEVHLDLDQIRNNFAASGDHLFDFLKRYDFTREIPFEERVTVYCQMISIYDDEFEITEKYGRENDIEFAMVYPK